MYHLGVPTTRSVSLIATGEYVLRDMFYDGNAKNEPGAIVCRLASNFIRFGSFEFHASFSQKDLLRTFLDYTIQREFPELNNEMDEKTKIGKFLRIVKSKTISMVAKWMSFGFVHGVMNTDNMSISGLTIDYGP